MTDAPKLKPCPFCGGRAELREDHDNSWVICPNCQISLEGFEDSDDAVAAWNTRADLIPDLPDALVRAALEQAADRLEPSNERSDWTQYAQDCHDHAEYIRALAADPEAVAAIVAQVMETET